jgi:DNA repair protein RadD
MPLRDYQQAAHDAAISFIKTCLDPCVIDAATGAGKSHIIAAMAETLHGISGGKHILCLAPSAELVTQNREKYLATGNPASIFSASAGGTCLKHPVVFGTPITVKNKVRRFGSRFCAVVVDEAHGITPTIKHIIEVIKECNPKLRVIGLSATPYRLGTGYIYAIDEKGNPTGEHAIEPYFTKLVYKIAAHELIGRGFLTQPIIGEINSDHYHTLDMVVNKRGKFDRSDEDRAYHGHGRKTAAIIADVVRQAQSRKGVMIFAATVQHAEECMASLPPGLSAIVTGKTKNREVILNRFKARKIKYLVNVAVLTTGFDAPHVDVIALLRATESVALLQQIIGRGLRIDDNKKDCLVLDYAENLERHCPDGDVFNPEIRTSFTAKESKPIKAACDVCGTVNEFSARENKQGYEIDKNGYYLDLDQNRIETGFGPMPAHYGRRCQGMQKQGASFVQCTHRWTFKACPHCEAENDIAARYCIECKGEIVDPNEKLRIEFKALKRDPTRTQTDNVLSWSVRKTITKRGNECLRVDYETEYRKFSIWYQLKAKNERALNDYLFFKSVTSGGKEMPKTITYQKDESSGFYKVFNYNKEEDRCDSQNG